MNEVEISKHHRVRFRLIQAALAIAILFEGTTRLGLAALFKKFWIDESTGLKTTLDTSFLELLQFKAPGTELTPSPLHFFGDRLLLWIFHFRPQFYGDLRLLLRLPHIVYWSLAAVAVFIFLEAFLAKKMATMRDGTRLLLATAAAFFYHSNTFAQYYAIESRAYSLWCSLATIHLLFFIWSVCFGLSRRQWLGYATASLLLVLTTVASLGMTLGCLILQFAFTNERKHLRRNIALVVLCFCIAGWNYSKMAQVHLDSGTWGLYFQEVGEVIAKSLHSHSRVAFALAFPFFCVFMPFWNRRSREYRVIYATVWGSLVYTLFLVLNCRRHHYLVASRQFIFLVPYLSAAYLIGIVQIARWAAALAGRISALARLDFVRVLIVWSFLSLSSRFIHDGRAIRHDLVLFNERHALSITQSSNCPEDRPDSLDGTLEKINDLCRSF